MRAVSGNKEIVVAGEAVLAGLCEEWVEMTVVGEE